MTTPSVAPNLDNLPDANARREGRYSAQRFLWSESSLPRLKHCGRSMSKHGGSGKLSAGHTVKVKHSEGVSGFSGLQSCGSVWACAVCSQKIASVRSGEIGAAADAWHMRGSKIVFLTLTMRHRRGLRLQDLWDSLAKGWSRITSGRPWRSDSEAFGISMPRVIKTGKRAGQTIVEKRIPYIRAVETTHGDNGWHVHVHALLFVSGSFKESDLQTLRDSIYSRWSDALAEFGDKDADGARPVLRPSYAHGVDVRLVSSTAGGSNPMGDYFVKNVYTGRSPGRKIGWEAAGGAGKTARSENRTPFQILSDVEALGDADDLAIWWEWETASKGRRQITWSVGLRAFLNLEAEETDEEIAERDLAGSVVMEFDAEDWAFVVWHKARVLSLVDAGVRDKRLLLELVSSGKAAQEIGEILRPPTGLLAV